MILRGVKLENIRSYTTADIAFPEGSVLLSGDIGSGKSSVLLAVDFALFGIQKDLSGASLLRHGKEAGSVELDFKVSDKEYTIKRTLKRKGDSVRQASAHIISNGVKKDLTAQEAKYFILELLGYPVQALRKDSALIYRYTVYTPQEQMRQIIDADPDQRLDLIRRLFGIDKYKRITENAELFAKELRGKVREISGAIQDLDEKKKGREGLSKEMQAEATSLSELEEKVKAKEVTLQKKKAELEALQKLIEGVQMKKQEYASLKSEFDSTKEAVERLKTSIVENEPKLKEMDEKLEGFKELKKPELTADEIYSKILNLEIDEKDIVSNSASLETEIASLSKILEKGVCGTCKQDVADPKSFEKGIEEKKTELDGLRKKGRKLKDKIEALRKGFQDAQKHDSLNREKASLEERKKDVLELKKSYTTQLEEKTRRMKEVADKANALAKEIKEDKHSQEFKEKQRELDEVRSAKDELNRSESALKQKIQGFKERIESLDKEIKKKEEAKGMMESYRKTENWLRQFFVKLMSTIERHVMVNMQQEFNSLFQKWFSMLVLDEDLNVRIDENFSVSVEQGGFETDYSYMSGGERTSIALAYRLALNRVINDLVENIKTKDLIILDEPTDGFSTDQMNAVRDVLDELNSKQTIMVSHEPKIESFVDQTIRFVKENHTSRVLSP